MGDSVPASSVDVSDIVATGSQPALFTRPRLPTRRQRVGRAAGSDMEMNVKNEMQNVNGEIKNAGGEIKNGTGDETRQRGSLSNSSQHGRRRSCDACRRKKKRCDQEQPCSRCVRAGSDCRYSKTRRYAFHEPLLRHQQRHTWQSGRGAVQTSEHPLRSTKSALVSSRMLPFKRCSFRASRATGLVGMQENAFLGDFFGCVGFLPLTNESQIREAMVKIMVPAAPPHEESSVVEDGQSGTLLSWGTFGNARGEQLPQDPSFSTFWSAVALGAIAKGCPFNAVERYSRLAGEALVACRFGTASAELAKASAILTHVYSFMGDMAKFREYLELSEYFLQASIEQGSSNIHEGLPDLLLHFRKVGNVESGPMDSSWSLQEDPPQLDRFTTKGGLYRFVAQSFRVFDQAVYDEAQRRCGPELERLYSWGPSHRNFDPNDTLPGEVSEAIAAVVETTNSLDFEPLQEAADSPSIRAGIGDLLINGTLIFENAAKGNLRATLEKLDRIVQVYERYPGLCRCLMGSHVSHMLLAILAAIDDCRARRMYERLRAAFNSCRASDTPPMPPWHEWQGMAAICSDFHCRVIETLIRSEHMKASITSSVNSAHNRAGLARTTRNKTTRNIPTSVAHWEDAIPATAAQRSTCTRVKTTSKGAENQDPVGAIYCSGATPAPLASRSLSCFQPDTGFESASNAYGVATKAIHPSSGSAGIGKHHADNAWLDDDEIAAVDLLKIVNAVLNAVHA